ncbi:MAG: hypothetical protein RLZZ401_540, partial [Pseudomonadota bacterium]
HGEVFGYELFNRSIPGKAHNARSDAGVLFSVLSSAGAEALFGKKTLFINCTHDSLAGNHLELVHPAQVVLEVPPVADHSPPAIAALVTTLLALRTQGFRLAFDHTVLMSPYAPWLALADFIKLDSAQIDAELLESLVRLTSHNTTIRLIADKVESAGQHATLQGLGVSLFQGYWFSRPVPLTARLVSPPQAVVQELISLVRNNAAATEIEHLLKHEPTLSFNLLRFINSSGFGLNAEITSFRHAVMILGMQKLVRWADMLLAATKPKSTRSTLGHMAVLRGRLMENLVGDLLGKEDADNAFVVGVFSLLDSMIGVPMVQALESLSLPRNVTDALLHDTGVFAPFLRMAQVCETGSDQEVIDASEALALTGRQVNLAHLEAMVWTESQHGDGMATA